MNKKLFYVLVIVGAICLLLGYWINPIGSLTGFVLSAIGIITEGIAVTILALSDRKDKKSLRGLLFVSGVCFLLGGRDLVFAGIDVAQGETEIYLMDCSVSKGTSRRAFFTSYNLMGIDVCGEQRRFAINESVYQEYAGEQSFSLELIGWEHSEIIKEIR